MTTQDKDFTYFLTSEIDFKLKIKMYNFFFEFLLFNIIIIII